jgi:hypothetical protein
VRLVLSTSERDRVDVAIWLLELLRPRHNKCRALLNAVVEAWRPKLPDLPEGYQDWDADIIDPLYKAADHVEFAPAEYVDSRASRRGALQRFANPDWPL